MPHTIVPTMSDPRSGNPTPVDFRETKAGRKQSWYGLKPIAKSSLSLPFIHPILRAVTRLNPSLRRSGRLPAPSGLREVTGVAGGARFVMLRPDRCIVAKELYWGRGRRPKPEDDHAVQLFAAIARHSDVVLDVGAYTGIFSLVATVVDPNVRAHAFEIVPDVCEVLRANCERNGVLDRVTIHNEGVGSPDTAMTVPTGSHGSALPDFYSARLHFGSGVQVPFRSLDSMIDLIPAGSRVLMKIDVEGTENEVFRYGQRFLEAFRPVVLCEVLHGVADPQELGSLLANHGYRYFLVREGDVLASTGVRPHPRFRDWVFTTRPNEELDGVAVSDNAARD